MDSKLNIQWYPGHMTKTRRQIEADGRLAGMEEYALKTKALNYVMDNAMVKRVDDPSVDYVRYGDVSSVVKTAASEYPEAFGM